MPNRLLTVRITPPRYIKCSVGEPRGFTLSELLIALVILGVIATFTIPKVLQSQQDARFKSIAKETAGALSESFALFKAKSGITSTTSMNDISPYINYIRVDSASIVDNRPTQGTVDCSGATRVCLLLANGSILNYATNVTFGGITNLNAVSALLDPDGKQAVGGEAVQFWIYTDGKLRTIGTREVNTAWNSGAPQSGGPVPAEDPSWFSWN